MFCRITFIYYPTLYSGKTTFFHYTRTACLSLYARLRPSLTLRLSPPSFILETPKYRSPWVSSGFLYIRIYLSLVDWRLSRARPEISAECIRAARSLHIHLSLLYIPDSHSRANLNFSAVIRQIPAHTTIAPLKR